MHWLSAPDTLRDMAIFSLLRLARCAPPSLLVLLASCANLPPFGADLHRQQVGDTLVRAPYATLRGYFGYIMPGDRPDEVRDGRKMFYIYAWLPAPTAELGVRVVSPVRGLARPRPGLDWVDDAYPTRRDSEIYFDPSVRVERCLAAISREDITKACPQWASLGDNDDSDELGPQPSGARHNAQLRLASSDADPTRALVAGLYRIGLTQAKVGDVQGAYLLQLGLPDLLPGVSLGRDVASLYRRVSGAAGPRL